MFFTQNPIGSSATEDLQDNAISFDYAMNSPAALWQDRFGKQHKTIQQALKDVGFKPTGFDFVSGGTLGIGDRDKCVFYPTDGYWYSWNGQLPYVVTANSSPAPGGKKGWGVVTRDERVVAREALRRTYLEVGLNLIEGSFEQGAVITSTTDVVLHEKTGKCYSGPIGNVPKGTDPLSGNFVTCDEFRLKDGIGVYLEEFGAVGDCVIDPVTGFVTGTDNTSAIKRAVAWMNGKNTINPESGGSYGFKLLGKPGASYRVEGNNILGNQRAEIGEIENLASSFYFDGNGCTFIWTPTSADDSWIDYAATYYRPTIKNYRVLVSGAINARAVLRSHSGPRGNVFQEGCFDNVVFIAGSDPSSPSWRKGNYLETVFDLDGDILQDRCVCRRSKFQQFKRMFRSAAKEAVGWVLEGTSFWTWVDGACYIELTKTFSGSHSHVACDVVFFGNGSKLVYANADNYLTYKNNGELYLIAPRVETKPGKQFTAVWANHGHIVVDGLNCRNGNNNFNAQSNFLSCEIYNDATVMFKNCVLPSRSRMLFTPRDNAQTYPGFLYTYGAVFENCEFQNYEYRPEYVSSIGNVTSYRDVVQGQYYGRNTKVSGSKSGNGIYGNCIFHENCKQTIPLSVYNSNGEHWLDQDLLTPLPPFCVIEDFVVYVPAGTGMTKFDVTIGGAFIRTVTVQPGVKNKLTLLTPTEWGIASPLQGAGGKIKIQPYNGEVAIQRAKGFGYFTVRGAVNSIDLTPDDTPKIF